MFAAAGAALATRFATTAPPVEEITLPGITAPENRERLEHAIAYDGAPFFRTTMIVRMEANCGFIMGKGACGYRGPFRHCNKTFGGCRAPETFGGFPGAELGAPVYARPGGGATCEPLKDGAFLGIVSGIHKGSPTKPVAIDVSVVGSMMAVRV